MVVGEFLLLLCICVVFIVVGVVGGEMGVSVCLHIPHPVRGLSCTKVHTGQENECVLLLRKEGGGEKGFFSPSPPPTSIEQYPTNINGGAKGGEAGGGGAPGDRGRTRERGELKYPPLHHPQTTPSPNLV